MADKDPFAEPNDSERTVIRPNPGGRRPAPPPAGRAAAPSYPAAAPSYPSAAPAPDFSSASMGVPPSGGAARSGAGDSGGIALTGMNQLIALATPLFSLISRIRNRAQHMDPDKLRQSVMAEVRTFESAARKAGIDAQQVKVARYALCATLDDVVLNTPWGEQSIWAQQSMVATFHRETVGGDRFFDLLARLEQDPAGNIDMLEFVYMCLSLGFEGRLRVEQGGSDKHLQIRNSLARIIRGQRGDVEKDLSPRWKGVLKPYVSLSLWKPVYLAVGATALILATIFGGLSWALGRTTENVSGQMSVMTTPVVPSIFRPVEVPPPPPPPPAVEEVQQLEKFTTFLATEIADGIVTVLDDGNAIKIRISGVGMFQPASDTLTEEFVGPISRVAESLKDEPGTLIIAGHSDSDSINTARFPDNAALSLARAQTVMRMMVDIIGDPSRMTAEGRADSEPLQSNDTAEGKAANRRIEILLIKGTG